MSNRSGPRGNTPETKREAEIAAAKVRLTIDRRLGRPSDPRVIALANEKPR